MRYDSIQDMKERGIRVGEMLGEGSEKKVFVDPDDKRYAKGIFHEELEESPNKIKSRFYLTKILHILYPKNVPDIHMSASKPNMLVVDRVEHDKAQQIHKEIIRVNDMIVIHGGIATKEERETLDRLNKELSVERDDRYDKSNKKLIDFLKEMEKLKVTVDISWFNFSYDKEGNPVYVDSFEPFFAYGTSWGFSRGRIELAIDELEDEIKKKKAMKYLNRLIALSVAENKSTGGRN